MRMARCRAPRGPQPGRLPCRWRGATRSAGQLNRVPHPGRFGLGMNSQGPERGARPIQPPSREGRVASERRGDGAFAVRIIDPSRAKWGVTVLTAPAAAAVVVCRQRPRAPGQPRCLQAVVIRKVGVWTA
jgi:hypothetical protein